jgi:hypothetical protein
MVLVCFVVLVAISRKKIAGAIDFAHFANRISMCGCAKMGFITARIAATLVTIASTI